MRYCSKCQYWRKFATKPQGECRINPPYVMNDIESVYNSCWPVTEPDDWCGQFKQKTQG